MEEDQEHEHVCKLCNQNFPSRRSLGAHMKCHIIVNSDEIDEKINGSNVGFEGGGHTGYGLRENPKKSWRFSDSNHSIAEQEKHCKVCGKGFQSLRALAGHMRHHSQREREENCCKECGKGFGSLKALFGHMRCHSEIYRMDDDETTSLRRRKRSKNMRYTANSSLSNLNTCSSVTGINQELEEGAMCLMMLSRDVGNWGVLNSAMESSDDDSAIFEAKPSNQSEPIAKNKGGNFVCNGDRTSKIKKSRGKKLDSCDSDWGNVLFVKEVSEFGDMDSPIASDEKNKVELEVCVDGFSRGDELEKLRLEDGTGIDLSDTKTEKKFHGELKIKLTEAELGKNSINGTGLDRAGLESMKSNSRKKARFDAYDPELGGSSCTKMKCISDCEVLDDSLKKGKYKCRTCGKVFHSHQALGGHQSSHKSTKSCSGSKIDCCEKGTQINHFPDIEADCKSVELECNENAADQEVGGATVTSSELKKSKVHECPICLKLFASGQALGGHMRAHFVANTDIRVKQTTVNQDHSDIDNIFNLNLPATIEEEDDGQAGFKPWWGGNDHKHEQQLVGLISN
ncbi:hypothetical protein L1049_002802 [Liquidambar formosana]|uniref:C2H2-type domain-containing protein n=1 Tax=Liquidambar formosana TaxID=63359 RepID=A0AAP0R8G3_LIQFO